MKEEILKILQATHTYLADPARVTQMTLLEHAKLLSNLQTANNMVVMHMPDEKPITNKPIKKRKRDA